MTTTVTRTPTPQSAAVAANVRAELARAGCTQRGLVARSGGRIAERTLARRMGGEVPFSIDDLALIAAALHIPITDLLVGVAA
jgi:transcriptional regulator with XRE-family HTH domain